MKDIYKLVMPLVDKVSEWVKTIGLCDGRMDRYDGWNKVWGRKNKTHSRISQL